MENITQHHFQCFNFLIHVPVRNHDEDRKTLVDQSPSTVINNNNNCKNKNSTNSNLGSTWWLRDKIQNGNRRDSTLTFVVRSLYMYIHIYNTICTLRYYVLRCLKKILPDVPAIKVETSGLQESFDKLKRRHRFFVVICYEFTLLHQQRIILK